MVSAAILAQNARAKMMIVGYPGGGKTGAIAPLVNAGLKIRMLDTDGNLAPLLRFSDAGMLAKNVDIIQLEDKLKGGSSWMECDGVPTAFTDACRAMKRWRYHASTGKVLDAAAAAKTDPKLIVDLGEPEKDWGRDTVLVLDSLTGLGRCAFRRVLAMNNRTPANTRDSDWGQAMKDEETFVEMITSSDNQFHVLILAHLKMVGPRDVRKGDSDLTKNIKEQQAELVVTRLFPSALGWALPQTIHEHVDTMILAEAQMVAGDRVKRVLRTIPRPELDLKLPAVLEKELPLDTGLLTIFNALTGGVEGCLANPGPWGKGGGLANLAPATQPDGAGAGSASDTATQGSKA